MTFLGLAALLAALPIASPAVGTPEAYSLKQRGPDAKGHEWQFRLMPRPSLRFGDVLRVDFRARLRLDAADSPIVDVGDSGAFDVGQSRIGVQGDIGNVVEFEVERELRSNEGWRDVFVNYRQFDVLRVQAGQFKLPFSVDENTSQANLDFAYRSRAATHLAPGRDRGVMLHGRPFTRMARYEIGVFDRDGDNARTDNPERVHGGTTIAGRITVQPFAARKSELADLRAGAAFTTSALPEGFPSLRGETALDARFFRGDAWVNGRRRRTGVEFRWRPGPFSMQAEYMRAADERQGQSVANTDLSPLLGIGWYVSGTWLLTGERKAGLDDPKRPLLPRLGTGAVEIAARVEALTFRSSAGGEPPSTSPRADVIAGNALHAVTLGVNWYLNRWMKLQANLIRERIDDPVQGPLPAQPVFWSRVLLFRFTL